MKIALINPALENFITGTNPDIVVKERGVTPPLGLFPTLTPGRTSTSVENERNRDISPKRRLNRNICFNSKISLVQPALRDVANIILMHISVNVSQSLFFDISRFLDLLFDSANSTICLSHEIFSNILAFSNQISLYAKYKCCKSPTGQKIVLYFQVFSKSNTPIFVFCCQSREKVLEKGGKL